MVWRYLICELLFSFFFFKQKTAYEMRISDWSSDVCSSDLHRDRIAGAVVDDNHRLGARQHRELFLGGERTDATIDQRDLAEQAQVGHTGHRRNHAEAGDRKSVVSGKSVSVRVALGGRRIIKKKTKQDNLNQTQQTHY